MDFSTERSTEIADSVVEIVGETPLVRLGRIHPDGNVVVKLEALNPGGSVKDRIAVTMLERAEASGWLEPGGVIIERTSGNTGLGLAIAAAVKGYHLILVMTEKHSEEKRAQARALGAEVVVCPPNLPQEDPESSWATAQRLLEQYPGAYQPDQYTNPANAHAHVHTTGPEIWRQTDGEVGVFVAGIGTGGTISGAGAYLKSMKSGLRVVGVDPAGSIYTADDDEKLYPYLTEGVGQDYFPDSFTRSVVDEYERVDDAESFETARQVAAHEGILIGGSGGMAVAGALRAAERYPDELVITMIPDSGRNYLSKVFSDEWMIERGLI